MTKDASRAGNGRPAHQKSAPEAKPKHKFSIDCPASQPSLAVIWLSHRLGLSWVRARQVTELAGLEGAS